MKATEFVKKFGWEYSKHILNEDSVILVDLDYAHLRDLIDSWDMVKFYGGLEKAKIRCCPAKYLTMESYHNLKQAIKDVESCL